MGTKERTIQIFKEAMKIIAESEERSSKKVDPTLQLTMIISYKLGASWADSHPYWISVEEELPKEGECKGELYVLYTEPLNEDYSYEGRYRIGEYDGDTSKLYIVANNRWKIYGDKWNNTRVTHWMRLPQPPKGDEK